MISVQWVIYMVVVCCALFVVLFFLYPFLAKQTAKHEEDEVDVSPMTLAHDRDWSEAISQKEIPLTSDHPDFLSTNRSTEDEYQRYAEEELKKNTKQMESFKGEDGEVIPERKKLTKDEQLALIKKSAEKKSV